MRRNDDAERAPACESHTHLSPTDQKACARLMPRGAQAQMAFLLTRYEGDSRVLAAVLEVRQRTVERHVRGSVLPPRRALRERLRVMTLDLLCPIRVAAAAERDARRGRRRTPREP